MERGAREDETNNDALLATIIIHIRGGYRGKGCGGGDGGGTRARKETATATRREEGNPINPSVARPRHRLPQRCNKNQECLLKRAALFWRKGMTILVCSAIQESRCRRLPRRRDPRATLAATAPHPPLASRPSPVRPPSPRRVFVNLTNLISPPSARLELV